MDTEDKKTHEQARTPAGDPPSAESRVGELEVQLAAAQDRWLRERADMENLKKRAAREQADSIRYGNEKVLRDILPVVDNLERALAAAEGGNGKPLVEGVQLVLKALQEVLERHGVITVPSKGAPFDPTHHEAMAQVETDAHPPNSVVEEHQRGYKLHDRLLRPALVTVSRAASVAKDKGGD